MLNIKAVKSLIARQWIWRLLLKLTTMHLLTAILLLTIIRASYSHFIIVLTTSILTDSGHTRKEAVISGIIHTIYLLVITYSLYIIWTISDMTASFLVFICFTLFLLIKFVYYLVTQHFLKFFSFVFFYSYYNGFPASTSL